MKELLAKVARQLEQRKIPYCVIGGQAVLVHGEPRFTRDIDLTLGTSTDRLPELLALAKAEGWRVLVGNAEAFVAQHLVLPCEDATSGVRVDFIFGLTPFERQAVERAQAIEVAGSAVCFATAEDLLIHKLVAGRPRDLEDAAGVMLKNPNLDRAYVRSWLEQFDRDLGTATVRSFAQLLGEP